MIKVIIGLLLSCMMLSAGSYPRLFSQMGTPLYEADLAFGKLDDIASLQKKIAVYHENVKKTLASGRAIENAEEPEVEEIQSYFTALRTLQKEHDAIIVALQRELQSSIEKDDHTRFMHIVDTHFDPLFEPTDLRQSVVGYYTKHKAAGKSDYLDKMAKDLRQQQAQRRNDPVSSQQAYAKRKQLILLTATWCPACKRAKAYLREKHIVFTEYDIERSSMGRRLYKNRNGHAVPMVIIGDEYRTGFSPEWVEKRLK